jgi:nitrate/nitrite transporter NarK
MSDDEIDLILMVLFVGFCVWFALSILLGNDNDRR